MSFGYYDNEWIDPPDPDFEGEEGEIVIEFDKDKFLYQGGSIEFENEASLIVDFYDEEYDSFVADHDSISELIYEALEPYLPEYEQEGWYQISGWVAIPYTVWVPTRLPKYEEDYETPEAEINGKPVAGEIDIIPIEK